MPATEQTKYNQQFLHVVFGVTGLVMLIATIWMFAKDHNREWKIIQRQSRSIENELTRWRIREADSIARRQAFDEINGLLSQISAQAPEEKLYAAYKGELENEARRLGSDPPTFTGLDGIYEDLVATAAEAKSLRARAVRGQTKLDHQRTAIESLRAAAEAAADEQRAAAETAFRQSIETLKTAQEEAEQADVAADEAEEVASQLRGRLIAGPGVIGQLAGTRGLRYYFDKAKLREEILSTDRKFKSADLDAKKGTKGLAIRDGRTEEIEEALQGTIYEIRAELDDLTSARQAATTHRKNLQKILEAIDYAESLLVSQLEENTADMTRLETSLNERSATYFTASFPYLGKRWLELPIVDAFNSPLKIDNLWTDGLTVPNGSFGKVRRFDRCTTCHRGIDKTMPGSAVEPAYTAAHEYRFTLFTPSSEPQPIIDGEGLEHPNTLENVYGIRLSPGLINKNELAVSYVEPQSLAANATMQDAQEGESPAHGLRVGDVLTFVGKDKVLSQGTAEKYLLYGIDWGMPLTVTVRRGLPNPYASHPRLDLFVGSLSPHKLSTTGCTVCHEGQGSATDFKWASHAPNGPAQGDDWAREHGWFDNHHWIYPMYPARFAESACLKCHHEVTELEPSDRFPDPPAPTVTAGFHLIEKYGCFGCHEINGYDGPDRRIGPDLRLEPNYFAAAAAITADPGFASLTDEQQEWARIVARQPYRDQVRNQLRAAVLEDADLESSRLTPASHQLASALEDVESPGKYRKVGPTLRYTAAKVGESFLYDWVNNPTHFRPSTKMPRFFGHWNHLADEQDLELTQRYEPVEVLGVVRYLMHYSQPFEYLPAEEGMDHGSADDQVARGQLIFETRCVACHQHQSMPAAESTFGPNLSNIGDKLSAAAGTPDGQAWLYSWIKQPSHYNPRTKMPDLFLDPITDENGQTTDPAADVAAFLMSSTNGWQPAPSTEQGLADTEATRQAVDDLALEYLKAAFFEVEALRYLEQGIPERMRDSLKGAEVELVGGASEEAKLRFIGRKTIAKYGCYGCHDVPGFETAKPIGTALAEWGRKEPSKLAFEHILEYLHHGGHGHAAGHETSHAEIGDEEDQDVSNQGDASAGDASAGDASDARPFDESFYAERLNSHDRAGFIWQKLKEPRSYDYKRTTNKTYNERLRMPLFPLTPQQREQVVSFVLGLVADPPAKSFVYDPSPRNKALAEGRAVLEKYNCGGCHILGLETWELEFGDETFEEPPIAVDYPFMIHQFSATELAASSETDPQRGRYRGRVTGMPAISNEDGMPVVLDDEGDPIEEDEQYDPQSLQFVFDLWQPSALRGYGFEVGVLPLTVPASTIVKKYPGWGGGLAKLLVPRVVELEKAINPAANGAEAWAWLPPPLIGEGTKVQPDWLHSFLLDPHPIRPAVFLRMPKFNMSPGDATKLVNYFAARDNADFPFEFDPRQRAGHLVSAEENYAERDGVAAGHLESAMKIVTNGNYCVKCHRVADFQPTGSDRAKAPDLSQVYARLRPDFVRRWIANPKRLLPYTNMPVNIPFDAELPHQGGVDQALYAGTSVEQVDALVDLLMNYPVYANQQNEIASMVEVLPEAAEEETDDATEGADTEEAAAAQVEPESSDLTSSRLE